MKANEFDEVISLLGATHQELVDKGLPAESPFLEIYPECDDVYLRAEDGISLTFTDEGKVFKQLHISLSPVVETAKEYKGELPDIFFRGMNQEDVHDIFGEPVKSQPPLKLPLPIGQTGGWDVYVYDAQVFPGVMLEFQYAADMEVSTIVFFLE